MNDPYVPGVGTRFSAGSFRGTVRYVGQVEGTEGTWLGVEWDDVGRGKHSGQRGGRYYFTCRVPKSGSFIRPSSKLSFGSSFLQALKVKYTFNSPLFEPDMGAKQYGRRNLADIEVEAPNMAGVIERSSQLRKLRQVGLSGSMGEANLNGVISESGSYSDVAHAIDDRIGEQTGDIKSTCPNVRDLDLSRSLLPSWKEVSKVTIELPLLDSLLLHFNRFAHLSPSTLPLTGAFLSLRDLRIDGILASWQDVLTLAEAMPKLENLQMGFNGISRLNGSETKKRNQLTTLKVLNLEGNTLSDWQDVWSSMEDCPALERLILSSNEITTISNTKRAEQHSRLLHISIWDNPISSWTDLDALDSCVGGIESLVLGGDRCPLIKEKPMQDIRLIAIARLSNLQSFNNAPVLPIERREAELYYISNVKKEALSEEQRFQLHPRWSHLCQLHGIILSDLEGTDDGLNGKKCNNGTLKDKLLIVKIYLSSQPPSSQPPYIGPAFHASPIQEAELTLLTTAPLRLLKAKIARSFCLKGGPKVIKSIWALLSPTLDPLQTTAQLLRNEMRPQEASTTTTTISKERITYEMDNLERSLHGYNFSIGDEIVLVV